MNPQQEAAHIVDNLRPGWRSCELPLDGSARYAARRRSDGRVVTADTIDQLVNAMCAADIAQTLREA